MDVVNKLFHWFGRHHTSATKKKMSEWQIGKVLSEATKKKISESHKGKQISEETRRKMADSCRKRHQKYPHPLLGKHPSETTRRKISLRGKGRVVTEETRLKISAGHKRANRVGSKSHCWRGGLSRMPYPFEWSPELKEKILRRDDHQCQSTFCSGNFKRLNIHHIDYDKNNLSYTNLITLCGKCHAKTNHNRNHYTAFFKDLMERRSWKN